MKQEDMYIIRRCSDGKFVFPEYNLNRIRFSNTLIIEAIMDIKKVDYVLMHLTNKESRYLGLVIWDKSFVYDEYDKDDFEVLKCKISLEKVEK